MDTIQSERVDALPIEIVREVLWHFGDEPLGQKPGGFVELLLRLMSHADLDNFAKLAREFPDYATAFHAIARTPDGLEWLRDRAKAGF